MSKLTTAVIVLCFLASALLLSSCTTKATYDRGKPVPKKVFLLLPERIANLPAGRPMTPQALFTRLGIAEEIRTRPLSGMRRSWYIWLREDYYLSLGRTEEFTEHALAVADAAINGLISRRGAGRSSPRLPQWPATKGYVDYCALVSLDPYRTFASRQIAE